MNNASAPASANAATRHSASSKLSALRLSDRAKITMSPFGPSSRSSHAALTRATASARGMTLRFRVCPHAFGATWSSMSSPANPAAAYPRVVLFAFIAFPYPSSASPMNGNPGDTAECRGSVRANVVAELKGVEVCRD